MSSKNDFEIMFSFIYSLIKNLSKAEYESILNGTGTLKYIEKPLNQTDKSHYDSILHKLVMSFDSNFDKMEILKNELNTKNQQINFCNYLNIEIKSKDSKEEIYNRIIYFVQENLESLKSRLDKTNTNDEELKKVQLYLEDCLNSQDAIKYLSNHKFLENKNNLMTLAKSLDVNVRKEFNNEEILNRIVDSVVGSKLRSMAIRGKIKK